MKKNLILIFLVVVFGAFVLYRHVKTADWTAFSSYGGVYGRIIKNGKFLVFGTDYTKLFVIDTGNDKNVKTVDLNIGTVLPQAVVGTNVYAISGDTYWKVDMTNSKPVWSFSSTGEFSFERSEIRGDRVYVNADDGSLYVLNAKDGKLIWKFSGQRVSQISSVLLDGSIYYAPDFWLDSNFVYLADRTGVFYALKNTNGQVVWQHTFDQTLVGNFTLYKNAISVFTSSGSVTLLNKKNGQTVWQSLEQSAVICSEIFKSNLIEVTDSGKFVYRDIKNGNLIWQSLAFGKGINCPYHFSADGVFTSSSGYIFKINMQTGGLVWQKVGFGKIISAPETVNSLFSKTYVFPDLDGTVWSVSDKQKTVWDFKTGSPIYASLLIDKNQIVIGTATGMVYRINKNTGRPEAGDPFLNFKTNLSSKLIGGNQIFEISLESKSGFINPWSEGRLSGVFTGPSGRRVAIEGFYYDNGVWKLRFNPPEKGLWTYKLTWVDHGKDNIISGKLTSTTDTSESFLRVDKTNPKRLTLDGKTVFNGVGIQESMFDFNQNGTPLDDWAIGGEASVVATSSAGVKFYFKNDKPVSLTDYVNTYGPKGAGFNIYRFSIMNGNNPLYRDLVYPPVYSIPDGKIADELLAALKANNMHIQLAFFNFNVPFGDTLSLPQQVLLKSYIKYIIARFGSYVDIWEIVNEDDIQPQLKTFLLKAIQDQDFEGRPITISTPDVTEDPKDPGLTIISPHWYETEDISQSDVKTAAFIDRFKDYPKPVVFGEQGNGAQNWDPTSATRMRIRLWTAFFKEGILIFWSMSDSRGMPRVKPFFANIYLGDEERTYVRNLQNFTNSFPLTAKPVAFSVPNGIRGYGLVSDKNTAGYFFHFADWQSPTSLSLRLNNQTTGEIEWYDPKTGNTLRKDACTQIDCTIVSPTFITDIAFKME